MIFLMNKERIFRIGTTAACEIVVPGGIPANAVWIHLAISDESMHLLTIVERGISCSVNGNVVSQRYWINEDDIIEIEGRILNWDYIKGDSDEPFKSSQNSTAWLSSLITVVGLVTGGLLAFTLL